MRVGRKTAATRQKITGLERKMARKSQSPSQLMELFLALAESLGIDGDREVGALADVGPESVANWRSGAVREFKPQKLRAAIDTLGEHIASLRAQAGAVGGEPGELSPLEIEEGSSPADLQRQFRDRVGYDYLGHRFLYFEPLGALAWENLIRAGYEQDCWLSGVAECAEAWLSTTRGADGQARGAIARALGLGRPGRARGLDLVSLGPGEGEKEVRLLEALFDAFAGGRSRPRWLSFVPVDVSIALLLAAARAGRHAVAGATGWPHLSVLPVVSDFEEGSLAFLGRLRSSRAAAADGLRLVVILGNVFGNVRDEETFVRQKLWTMLRPGDLLWVEFGLRCERPEDDPLFALTENDREETASEANRRLLLEGPYRRWAVATGRASPELDLRVWVREDDDSARVPGSYNFCHDLLIRDERRVVTMLYSRRYDLEELARWFERLDFAVEGISRTRDSKGRSRVGHLLLRRLG